MLILEDLVDHTNVGAAIRSAAAMGFDAILTSPHCADPLYRRAVRVSMGTVFSLPWTRIDQWPDTSALKEHGFTVAGLALSEQAISLPDFCAYLQGGRAGAETESGASTGHGRPRHERAGAEPV